VAAWFKDNHGALFARAYFLTGNAAEADDLVGDTAEVFVKRRHSINSPSAYATQVMLSRLSRRAARRRIAEFVELSAAAHDRGVDEPDAAVAVTVAAALREITALQRAVLILRYWDDLTADATASVLRRSRGTVRRAEAGALAKLRVVLGEDPRRLVTERALAAAGRPRVGVAVNAQEGPR
jgi:RNA polymerase sigma factor (sigma-70 family)